jgi:hypothetical protein
MNIDVDVDVRYQKKIIMTLSEERKERKVP